MRWPTNGIKVLGGYKQKKENGNNVPFQFWKRTVSRKGIWVQRTGKGRDYWHSSRSWTSVSLELHFRYCQSGTVLYILHSVLYFTVNSILATERSVL